MTHPKYSAKYLLRKGISYCKQIAKELGITPEGDKRQLFTWVDAIVTHQATIQPVEEPAKPTATIEYDNSVEGTVEGEYMVIADGEVIRRFRTYLKAEKWASANYSLVSPQEVAQTELEAQLEGEKEDAPERPRFEPVEETQAAEYHFVSSPTLGVWHWDYKGQWIATITLENSEDGAQSWILDLGYQNISFKTFERAAKFMFDNAEVLVAHRGGGRDKAIEDIQYLIEDTYMMSECGSQIYAVLRKGLYANVLEGYIYLSDDRGWTADRKEFFGGYEPVVKQLLESSKYTHLVAA